MKRTDILLLSEIWSYQYKKQTYKIVAEKVNDEEQRIVMSVDDSRDFDGSLFEKNDLNLQMLQNMAKDAVKKYYDTKRRFTTHFYAKHYTQRKFYQAVVDDLMKTGNYKLIRTQNVEGGKLWVLQHKEVQL